MKKTIFTLALIAAAALVFSLMCLSLFADGESPASTGTPEGTEEPAGITIPAAIVFAVIAGAIALGGLAGYWFARKR